MQSLSELVTIPKPSGGGRVASDAYRASQAMSESFSGLEENTNRYDLLLLVKKVGKQAGFSPRAIQLLDYYMAFTRDIDWEEGSRPIVYQSLSRTALDMGVSERQIQKLEQQLFTVGAITWNDSGNHKRYGQRDPQSGRILYAYGVELTPLAYLRTELEQKLHDKKLYDEAWLATKREISWYRRQIRAVLSEMRERKLADVAKLEEQYDAIAYQLRTHIRLEELRTLFDRHRCLHSEVLERVGGSDRETDNIAVDANMAKVAAKGSSKSEPRVAHYKPSTQQLFCSSPADDCFQKSVVEPSEPKERDTASGLQHLTLKQVLLASSERFQAYLPLKSGPLSWNDVVEAAYRLRTELGISQHSWSEACQVVGRAGAAVCVVVVDRALNRKEKPVRQPAAYFRGMVNRACSGQLRLQQSVHSLGTTVRANQTQPQSLIGADEEKDAGIVVASLRSGGPSIRQ